MIQEECGQKYVHVNTCTCVDVDSIICNYQWILLKFHRNSRLKYPQKLTTVLTLTPSQYQWLQTGKYTFILRYHSNQI